jgi:hypothetical protein
MTDKQKNIALLFGFLIFFILAYFFSIKKTVDLNYLEQQQLGKIVSLNLEKKKNYRRNKEELTVKISIQKLSKEKD